MSGHLEGNDQLIAKLKAMPEKIRLAVARAMYLGGLDIVQIAIPLTPVEYGPLHRSFMVSEPGEIVSAGMLMKIWNTQSYAVWVHERLEVKHKVGEAKFLELAIQQARSWWAERLIQRTQEALRG